MKLPSSVGIINQNKIEYDAIKKLSISWKTIIFCASNISDNHAIFIKNNYEYKRNDSKFKKFFSGVNFQISYYKWIYQHAKEYDVLIIRYSSAAPLQTIFILVNYVFLNKKVFFVRHTRVISELKLSSSKSKYLLIPLEELLARINSIFKVGIMGVTKENINVEKNRCLLKSTHCYHLSNGENHTEKLDSIEDKRKEKPEMIIMASYFYIWNGLDLLLDSVMASDKIFTLHIVGEIDHEKNHRALCDERVVCHGTLTAPEIDKLMSYCWIGIDSLALWRKNMSEGNTLKTREYLLHGLPVYAGHADCFPEDFLFYKVGSASIDNLLEFSIIAREYTKKYVREIATPHISKEVILQNTYRYLQEIIGNENS